MTHSRPRGPGHGAGYAIFWGNRDGNRWQYLSCAGNVAWLRHPTEYKIYVNEQGRCYVSNQNESEWADEIVQAIGDLCV
jgi:hypothetical protein